MVEPFSFENVIVVVVGLLALIGGVVLFLRRTSVHRFIVEMNTRLYGKRQGERMAKAGAAWGIGVPAVFCIFIGGAFVYFGLTANIG